MKKLLRVSIASALFSVSTGSVAVNSSESVADLPILEQESQHSVSAKRISSHFLRAHYKEIDLDDSLSAKVFDRYLRSLDLNRNVFFGV